MNVVICKCSRRRTIAGELAGRPFLSFIFACLDFAELSGAGWSFHAGAWCCVYCTRRRNLMRGIEGGLSSNVTEPPPPTEEKM